MFFNNDFDEALKTDKQNIINKGIEKINFRSRQLSKISKRELKKEIERIKKNAKDEDESQTLTLEQIRVRAEDNLLNKLAKKEKLAELRKKDQQYFREHKGVFKKGSRDDFPYSATKKQEYFSDSIRLAGKTHADKNVFTKEEISRANFLLSQMYSCHGQVVAVFKNEKHEVVSLEDFPATKISPKRESTITLAETLLNVSTIEGTDVYLRTPTFWYNKEHDFSTSKICSLYNMVIDVDNCPLSQFKGNGEATMYIYEKYPFFKEFKPDAIIDTGNKGFHAIYCFDKNIAATKSKYDYIAKLIGEMVGADLSKCTANGSTRMPYTMNSKGGRSRIIFLNYGVCNPAMRNFDSFSQNILYYAQSLYLSYDNQLLDFYAIKKMFNKSDEDTAKEIEEDLKEGMLTVYYDIFKEKYGYMPATQIYRNAKGTKDGVKQTVASLVENENYQTIEDFSKTCKYEMHTRNTFTHIENRLHDLEEFAKRNEYNFPGCRNNYMALYCFALFLQGKTPEEVWELLKKMNENFGRNALRTSEIRATYKYALRAINEKKYYKLRISDFSMANMLGLDEDDFLYMRNRYTAAAKKKHKEDQEEEYNKKRRKERMFAERQYDKIYAFMQLLRKHSAKSAHYIVVSAAKEAGISKATAYRYIQAFSLLNDIEDESKQKIEESADSRPLMSIIKKTVENFKLNTVQYIKNYLSLVLLGAKERLESSIFVPAEDVLMYKNGLMA